METTCKHLLVAGAGHAGSELAVQARKLGWRGPITLLGQEAELPYQRPPLSKAWLAGKVEAADLHLRPQSVYDAAEIQWLPGARLQSLDRAAQKLMLDDGRSLAYDALALCLGGRPRPWAVTGVPSAQQPENLHYLRSMADAESLKNALTPGARALILGAGYVGLEVAATAVGLGVRVTVLEIEPRVLARVAGVEVARFFESVHRNAGVALHTDLSVASVEMEHGRIRAVIGSDGTRFEVDLVVAGLGMIPNIEAAIEAGLVPTDSAAAGIPVDANGCTTDERIVAAGDCTVQQRPSHAGLLRIESVPNALEQARAAAAWLTGKPKPNHAVPWFWSDHYHLKLQTAGLAQGYDQCTLRGDPASHAFVAFYLRQGCLLAVDAVNRPAEFMLARRALTEPRPIDIRLLSDESVSLKAALFSDA